jgi:hypothetical protein
MGPGYSMQRAQGLIILTLISPLPILIPLQLKYSLQDTVFKYRSLRAFFDTRNLVSKSYNIIANIPTYILILKFLERSREEKSVRTE